MSLTADILSQASALGFDLAGVIPVGSPPHQEAFAAWLAAGYHGEMAYLSARAAERGDPSLFAPGAQSIILLAANYPPEFLQLPAFGDGTVEGPATARIARYAQGPDYHDVIKPRLYALDAFIRARTGRGELGKVFVDSAPVLERDFAEQAGLGFVGRNTCLITPGLGSWTVLAGLLVPEVLEAGLPAQQAWKLETGSLPQGMSQGCGRCTRCLDACPTQAFVAPHVLDARRCISYLTIELRGPIPHDLRPLLGNWVFGCDVCQEVCPYNRQATRGKEHTLETRSPAKLLRAAAMTSPSDFASLILSELLTLDEAGFRARFHGTPVLRARRRGLMRNACVAAGNEADPALIPSLVVLLADAEPLVRGHAAWALGRIGGGDAARALALAVAVERDAWVRDEIVHAMP